MLFELRFDKKKRAFALSSGQYEYSNTVNDEVMRIVTINTLSLRRRLCITRENVDYKYELLKENINEIIELLSLDLPAVAEIISNEYKSVDIERCYDDLYNLFFLIMSDGSQLTELAIKQSYCEDRYDLPKLEELLHFMIISKLIIAIAKPIIIMLLTQSQNVSTSFFMFLLAISLVCLFAKTVPNCLFQKLKR